MTAASDARQLDSMSGSVCRFQGAIDSLRQTLNQALVGKQSVVEMVLACLLARGHLLFEDLPGLGKTTLAKALAQAVGGRLARIQCTPDLLPSDVTGFQLFNPRSREFEFRAGPVFSDVLLADEINRATPRTQSALFEAMAERQVTIDDRTWPLSESFFVIATQNPAETHGAFPLPEAQLDRFAMKLGIGFPDRASELQMLADAVGTEVRGGGGGRQVLDPEGLRALQQHVASVTVGPAVQGYLVDLARATRTHRAVTWGLSPRGVLTWQRVAQAWAHLAGRDFVLPDDVQRVAVPVLAVRLTGIGEPVERLIEEILASVPVPVPLSASRGGHHG